MENYKKTILIVEDDEVSAALINASFDKEQNYNRINVYNGLEAVEQYNSNPDIDLILMDLCMPIMDGFKATKKIRQIEHETKRKKIPIIALTALSDEKELRDCLKAGCDTYIKKPIQLKEFSEKIEKEYMV
jgi:CheY-like chemotaxis protein